MSKALRYTKFVMSRIGLLLVALLGATLLNADEVFATAKVAGGFLICVALVMAHEWGVAEGKDASAKIVSDMLNRIGPNGSIITVTRNLTTGRAALSEGGDGA